MSDRHGSKYSNQRRNDKQYQKNHKESVRVTCMKVFQYEIDDLKDQLRETYALEVKKSMDQTLSDKEEKMIEDKSLNMAVVERLQKMLDRFEAREGRFDQPNVSHSYTLLNFFYLVRLAQQGFFQLLTSAYPNVELQAVTYLCDKLVGASLHATRSKESDDRKTHKKDLRNLIDKLHFGDIEPVAEGFKTTFRHIRQAIDSLAGQSFQKNNNAEQTEEQKLSQANNDQLGQPPIWIVMPYTSMVDSASLNMPGLINSLSAQLPQPFSQNTLIPPQTILVGNNTPESYNNNDSGDDLDEGKNEVKENEVEQNEVEQKKEDDHFQKQEENEETAIEEKEELVKEDSVEQAPEEVEETKVVDPPQETEVVQIAEETNTASQDNLEDDDDRFADPDMDEISEMTIQPSTLDSFMDSVSDELNDSITKEETEKSDSPASSSKSKLNDSFSNTMKEDTKTPDSPRSTDSKTNVNTEDTASPDWKNFRAPDQTNRKRNSSGKKNQNRRSQASQKDKRRQSVNGDNGH